MIFHAADACPVIALIFLLCLSNHFSFVFTLDCYVCNSRESSQEDCFASAPEKYLQECPPNAVACRKFLHHFYPNHDSDAVEVVTRQCALTQLDNICKTLYGTNGKRYWVTICECPDNGCNRAPRPRHGSAVVMGVPLLLTVWKLFIA